MKKFKEFRKVDEAPLVMDNMEMIRAILNKIEDDFSKLHLKGKLESAWPKLQMIAKIAGYGITKKKQPKGRIYRYDIKR